MSFPFSFPSLCAVSGGDPFLPSPRLQEMAPLTELINIERNQSIDAQNLSSPRSLIWHQAIDEHLNRAVLDFSGRAVLGAQTGLSSRSVLLYETVKILLDWHMTRLDFPRSVCSSAQPQAFRRADSSSFNQQRCEW
jgi:hypothetical protein